ncbi:MAG: Asp-tRNA(Asn)/Glu-tRNA(Gln) amidotransferase subunit GatA [Bacteroidetes bacterium]|nr:Asp-tRNA(Asn)/Glu-tRNA(Gln) amidotransferase subunit GatA [Bacteroidota bacterium]
MIQIQKDLYSGKTSCAELVSYYLKNIESQQKLNAYLEVFADEAIQAASIVDEKIKSKTAGKLAGLVISIKDNICYKNHKLSASSKILEGFTSLYSATVTERLLKEDAIIIGRCNCDEFAMGSSNENSAYGNVLNPHDLERVPGGSSGGSAVAVAADLCHASLGTDTGGSIRQPASFCGVVGLKPTYGRVSRYGAIAYASSYDQIGPITKSVEDAALIMEVISGADEYDSTASQKKVEEYSTHIADDCSKVKVAYLADCLNSSGLNPEIKKRIEDVLAKLKQANHSVSSVDFPYLDYLVPTYNVLTTAEASSNLARYDGIHYGYRSKQATDLDSTYKKSRTEGFGKEVKRRIMLGTFVLSAGYYDAYYAQAQKVRRVLTDSLNKVFETSDYIILPSTPGTAFKIGQNTQDPIAMYLEDIFTVLANHTGMPAISIPMGKHSNGLPFGIQVIGKKFDERGLLAFSNYLINNY